uniref:Cadherin domain-containing protein n=1 Tax=Dicentrarchus labrax TaxID=13489 RepID=A0A8P4G384_DICLA
MGTIHISLFVMLILGVYRSSSEILQRQKRRWIIDSFSIDEGYKGPFPYSLGKITIEKNLTLFKIHGQGVDEEPKGVLQINEHTGDVTVHRAVDFEKFHVFRLTFQALDKESHVIETQLGIEITIIDSNDNPPKFDLESYEIWIEESKLQGTEVITIRASDDDTSKNNGIFNFKIVSVTPKPHELEFYLTQNNATRTATISFKGCLDHETAEKYTIVVEAKDCGDKIKLSSSCTIIVNIEDGNNHLPYITGQTGPGRVKEDDENVLVSRLQVKDKDTKGTAAWRAVYKIQGDKNNNFRITTDNETNEGLLYVEKPLNYEDTPLKNLTISVENEIPYHSCKVVKRTSTGLWVITDGVTIGSATGATGATLSLSIRQVTVTVVDVNDPPIFDKPNQHVKLSENVAPGQYLVTFTAKDPDIASANTFVYIKGNDPADWVTVDPKTGKITTSKIVDRESPFVKNNIYNVTIYAVDNGKPPMTSTATLSIHIADENDNTPTLSQSTIAMCQSDGPSLANITALDLDEEPYGGPFHFKLLGDVEGKWRVDPPQGDSVNLVKENVVHSGHFELLLEVSDLQHQTTVHNLSVTVCHCLNTARPDCRSRKATGSAAGGGALGIIFFSILLLAGALLAAFLVSCKMTNIRPLPNEGTGQSLIVGNTEEPGTDCKVNFEALNHGQKVPTATIKRSDIRKTTAGGRLSENAAYQTKLKEINSLYGLITDSNWEQRRSYREHEFTRNSSMRSSMGASSAMRMGHQHRNYMRAVRHSTYSAQQQVDVGRCETLIKVLKQRVTNLQAPGEELGDYAPHVYADEGDTGAGFDLDAISIPEMAFDLDLKPDLIVKFSTLASICMPSESTSYSTKTSCVMEKLETATLIQVESQKTNMNIQSHF